MAPTWLFVAAVQLPILILIAMAVWLMPRLTLGFARQSPRATTSPLDDRGAAPVVATDLDPAPIDVRTTDASSRGSLSTALKPDQTDDAEDAALTETQSGWQRIRAGLCARLDETAMSADQSDELHRLLCTVDRLLNVSSPERTLRPDGDSPSWGSLTASLVTLRQAHTAAAGGAANASLIAAVVAVIAAGDELRGADATPPATQREQELKQMISQFTKDSRDMLASIRRLESENVELRTALVQTANPA